jgi:hypothetical protein
VQLATTAPGKSEHGSGVFSQLGYGGWLLPAPWPAEHPEAGAPQTPGMPLPPQVSGAAQPPQSSVPPQPSPAGPHVMFCCAHVFGTQVLFVAVQTPVAPQVAPAPQPEGQQG